jgi:hypothetical protein
MNDEDDAKGRFTATAEDVRPLGRPLRTEDRTSKASAAARRAAEAARKAAEDDGDG